MKLIERRQYLDLLESVSETPDIKVITGVRRSGNEKTAVNTANINKKSALGLSVSGF